MFTENYEFPPSGTVTLVTDSLVRSAAAADAAPLAMARPSRQTLGLTSLRRLDVISRSPPPPASVLRRAAAVALPCAVLYRAVLSHWNAPPPVQNDRYRRLWRDLDPPRAPVMVPGEYGDLDPISANDPVSFHSWPPFYSCQFLVSQCLTYEFWRPGY
jgi:hypothetical protein